MELAKIVTKYPALAGHESRMVTAKEAVALVQAGNNVYLGTACATPRLLCHALEKLTKPPLGVTLFHFVTDGAIPLKRGKPSTKYKHKCFFVGNDLRHAAAKGWAEYIPVSLSQVPKLVANGSIPIDVAFIQVSPPDEFGYSSLGVSVDVTASMVLNARHILAEINPNMPRTTGDSLVHVSRFNRMVWNDEPVIEVFAAPIDEVTDKIAQHVASIIEDRATLQIGFGPIPQATLRHLGDRRDLGIHTDVITDALVELMEKGVVTGRGKSQYRDMVVGSYCLGTRRLYDLIDGNPLFSLQSIERVSAIEAIAKQYKMASVNQACAVDLTGQVSTDQFAGEFCSGATQVEFIRGAALSPGGKPIVCLPSTTEDGKASRIRPQLLVTEGVAIARSDVHYVVTEYGIAYLFGKSMRERALALIRIAHPDFRAKLMKEARTLGYVEKGLSLKRSGAVLDLEERHLLLRDQKTVLIRPTRASDTPALQGFFRSMSKEDRYTRFFRRLNHLSDAEAQRLCHVDQDSKVAFLVLYGAKDKEVIIGSAFYFVNPSSNMAEVAYMVSPAWQGKGIGTAMQLRLMEHAKQRGLRGFTAEIQAYNANMINLAKRACDDISIERHGETHEVTMLFG